jgi:hypothetical protein
MSVKSQISLAHAVNKPVSQICTNKHLKKIYLLYVDKIAKTVAICIDFMKIRYHKRTIVQLL